MLALLLLAAQPPEPPTSHDRTAPPAAEEQAPAVDLSAVYTLDVWRNARGGLRRGWRYLDNLDVTGTIFLTDAGARMAARSRSRHEVVVRFLRMLGVSDEVAELDAEDWSII